VTAAATVAAYCADEQLRARIGTALARATRLTSFDSWERFEHGVERADCAVVGMEWLRGEELVERLERLRRRLPAQPLVLVTAKDADAIRQVSALGVTEIVWPHEVERGLAAAVDRAGQRLLPQRMAAALDGLAHLPLRLRQALRHALLSSGPAPTVSGLAAFVGCDRRTFWRYAAGPLRALDPPLRPQDLVNWILLLRLAALKVPGRRWSALGDQLGVHEQSLARIARRLTGLGLRELAAHGQAGVGHLFETRVLGPLRRGAPAPAAAGLADTVAFPVPREDLGIMNPTSTPAPRARP
jgi:hypothetical protein